MNKTSITDEDKESVSAILLRKKLAVILAEYPDADRFLCCYGQYASAIDDIIDEHITDPQIILNTFSLGEKIFSCRFYQANISYLYPILRITSFIYRDSVVMEHSDLEWKRSIADTLRHSAHYILLGVLDLITSEDKINEISLLLHNVAYENHHNDKGERV